MTNCYLITMTGKMRLLKKWLASGHTARGLFKSVCFILYSCVVSSFRYSTKTRHIFKDRIVKEM